VPHVTGQILLCVGAIMTAIAPLLYAVIKPGAILCVAGADFGVAVGLIFVSKLSLSSEHSSAGGLFQTALQVGNAFGTAISTLVYTSIAQQKVEQGSRSVETVIGHGEYPPDALLPGLRTGFWTSCGLALGGESECVNVI
jgi:MFS family permease